MYFGIKSPHFSGVIQKPPDATVAQLTRQVKGMSGVTQAVIMTEEQTVRVKDGKEESQPHPVNRALSKLLKEDSYILTDTDKELDATVFSLLLEGVTQTARLNNVIEGQPINWDFGPFRRLAQGMVGFISKGISGYSTRDLATIRTIGALKIDLVTQTVLWNGTEVKLTPNEFAILNKITSGKSLQPFSAYSLAEMIDPDFDNVTAEDPVKVHVNGLRKKLVAASGLRKKALVKTKRGYGYCFDFEAAEAAIPLSVRRIGKLNLDFDKPKAFWSETPINLSELQFNLLTELTNEPSKVCTKEELLKIIDPDSNKNFDEDDLRRYINRLRKKLSEVSGLGSKDLIKTRSGRGYQFDSEATEEPIDFSTIQTANVAERQALIKTIGKLRINFATRRGLWNGVNLGLSSLEFDLLDKLTSRNYSYAFSKEELSTITTSNSIGAVDSQIYNLRTKLEIASGLGRSALIKSNKKNGLFFDFEAAGSTSGFSEIRLETINKELTGKLQIHFNNREVFWKEKKIELDPVEYDLLVELTSQERPFTREELLASIGSTSIPGISLGSIKTYISTLRTKLSEASELPKDALIETVFRTGYRFNFKAAEATIEPLSAVV